MNFTLGGLINYQVRDSEFDEWRVEKKYRKFTVIKDGNLNMKSIDIVPSLNAFSLLQRWGCIHEEQYQRKRYSIELASMPMMVSQWASGPLYYYLLKLLKEDLELSRKIKVIEKIVSSSDIKVEGAKHNKKGVGFVDRSFEDYPCYLYILEGYVSKVDLDSLWHLRGRPDIIRAERSLAYAQQTRVQFLTRLIFFAIEITGGNFFRKLEKYRLTSSSSSRKYEGKDENLYSLASLGCPELSLRRVHWIETVKNTHK
jgi:hypothetical protein